MKVNNHIVSFHMQPQHYRKWPTYHDVPYWTAYYIDEGRKQRTNALTLNEMLTFIQMFENKTTFHLYPRQSRRTNRCLTIDIYEFEGDYHVEVYDKWTGEVHTWYAHGILHMRKQPSRREQNRLFQHIIYSISPTAQQVIHALIDAKLDIYE